MDKTRIRPYISAIMYVVLGIVMTFYPRATMNMVCYIFAVLLMLVGLVFLVTYFIRNEVISAFRYDLVIGIILMISGILIITRVDRVIALIPMLLGLFVVTNGIIKLQRAIDMKRLGIPGSTYVMIFAIISMVAGVFLLFEPAFIANIMIMVIGICFLFSGITDLITMIMVDARIRKNNKVDTVNDPVVVRPSNEALEKMKPEDENEG